jgi:allophanate hydrolase
MLADDPGAIHPVVREIVESGVRYHATAVFDALYAVEAVRHESAAALADCDVLALPTAPRLYTIAEMAAAPVARNAKLGTYTNFVNLLDMAAVAVPAGFCANGLPWGISLIAQAHQDLPLLRLAERLHPRLSARLGAVQTPTPAPRLGLTQAPWQSGRLRLAVCGAHMENLPLHGQIRARDGRLVARTTSAPVYRLYALPGGPPARPGMVKIGASGAAIELEVWDIAGDTFGAFCQGVPAPLAIGKVMLADGSEVPGFVCEAAGAEGGVDITAFGGWRAYLASLG